MSGPPDMDTVQEREALILSALAVHPDGLTSIELGDYLEMGRDWVSPRMRSLVERGFVREAGKRYVSDSPRPSVVWALPEVSQ